MISRTIVSLFLLTATYPVFGQVHGGPENSIHVFYGRYTSGNIWESINVYKADYESNHVLAAAYGKDLKESNLGYVIGVEIGLGLRFGDRETFEVWGGPSLRSHGLSLFNKAVISSSVTGGLSLIDRSIGVERMRETNSGGNARLLFYFGFDLYMLLLEHPDWELVYRLHHRSGGSQTLGNFYDGHNANTIGIRHRF